MPVVPELGQGGVEARARRGHDDRNPLAEGEEPDRIHPPADRLRLRPHQGREAEGVAQERFEEAFGERAGVPSRGAARLHLLKAGLGDAPASRDLVADLEPLRDAVVGRLLRAGLKPGHLAQPLRPEQAAFDRERVEGDPSLAARAASTRRHGQSTFGRST